jgi:putative SOS response-associated peptidase YedK
MCTNFERIIEARRIKQFLAGKPGVELKVDDNFSTEDYRNLNRENIRITENILAVSIIRGDPAFTIMNWSINWNARQPIYNSRIETIREEPRWTKIFNESRCLIPATAFFEYRPFENDSPETKQLKKEKKIKRKTKFGISIPGQEFFFIGGIYVWNGNMNYCSMITTPAHKDLQIIPHHRSPYMLNSEQAMEYLQGSPDYLLDNISAYPKEMNLEVKQVSEY